MSPVLNSLKVHQAVIWNSKEFWELKVKAGSNSSAIVKIHKDSLKLKYTASTSQALYPTS